MNSARPTRLDPPVDPSRDHVLGSPDADMTLLEYGSYACPYCHAAHEVVATLRNRFGERMRYGFRHLPIQNNEAAAQAAVLAESAAARGQFWPVHDALMRRGPDFADGELAAIAEEFGLPPPDTLTPDSPDARRVAEDIASARRSGALVTPTFFINNRRYEGAWDEAALSEAMVGSLGHRLRTAQLDFVRWGPSTGLLLLVMSLLAIAMVNSPARAAFEAFWHAPFGLQFGGGGLIMPLLDWVNHGLLTVFFLVVGLEIKREFTIGRLATRRAAALPIAASIGGMVVPALIYMAIIPTGPLSHGWGVPIATDTAFAIALIVLLGDRVPVELRIFLTAAVVVDDLIAIAVVALFYSDAIHLGSLGAAVIVTGLLATLNHWHIYRVLPYLLLGAALWFFLHAGGLHATLAGVILAMLIPTRPPANLEALRSQAELVFQSEISSRGPVMRHGPSEPALRALDAIMDRIESPAAKVLRTVEPWSSYIVLPVFALANAGVAWSAEVVSGHGTLITAIVAGLVIGKPTGILLGAWLAVLLKLAVKPAEYNWRQMAGAGALGGIGFTMSLFIAGQAFGPAEFAAAKIAIFLASLLAGTIGVAILWPRRQPDANTVEAPA